MIFLNIIGQILYCFILALLCAIITYFLVLICKLSRLDIYQKIKILFEFIENKKNLNLPCSPSKRQKYKKKKITELSDIDPKLFKNLGFNLKPLKKENEKSKSNEWASID